MIAVLLLKSLAIEYCSQFTSPCLSEQGYRSLLISGGNLPNQFSSENLISSIEETFRQKALFHHLKTDTSVMK
jgi:hypothetical protein